MQAKSDQKKKFIFVKIYDILHFPKWQFLFHKKNISEKIWLKNCSVFLDVYICDRMEGFESTGGLLIVLNNRSIFFWITIL